MTSLPVDMQLTLLNKFHVDAEELARLKDEQPSEFAAVEREGRKLFRYRAGDYRIYFEPTSEGLLVHRVLHRNTIRDFLFRSKLPTPEDDELGEPTAVWKLIEEGERSGQAK